MILSLTPLVPLSPPQPAECTLAEGREQVARAAGLPLRRQFFVVAEERVRAAGLSVLARRVGRHLAAPRDLRASVVAWINFIFLPEAVNRCGACALRWQRLCGLCRALSHALPCCCLEAWNLGKAKQEAWWLVFCVACSLD